MQMEDVPISSFATCRSCHWAEMEAEIKEYPFLFTPIRPTVNSFLSGYIPLKHIRNKMPADIPPDAKIKMANDLRKAIRELRDRGLMVAAKWYVSAFHRLLNS